MTDDEELFKVEKIVDSKVDKNGVPLYKIRWKGYLASDDTWEPTENIALTGHGELYLYYMYYVLLMRYAH